jgi:hypothetical protein
MDQGKRASGTDLERRFLAQGLPIYRARLVKV